MCNYRKYIINPYTKKRVLVNCGKCKSCLQEAADKRAFRIRNSCPSGFIGLFVTLDYMNCYLPVVNKSHFDSPMLPVYRMSSPFDSKGIRCIGVVKNEICDTSSFLPTPNKFGNSDYTGVCFYKDFQNFFKRLRITLKRNYNYDTSFKYYCTTEYGPTTQRPHAHILLFIPQKDASLFRSVIPKVWPFSSPNRWDKRITIAIDAAAYVASYVSSYSSLPKNFQTRSLRPKHSFSKDFGISSSEFTLPSLLDKVRQGDFRYAVKDESSKCGTSSFPIPQYVVNRYFPNFKGFSRLSSSALDELLFRFAEHSTGSFTSKDVELSDELKRWCLSYKFYDIFKPLISYKNHFDKYCRILGIDSNLSAALDYNFFYKSVYRARSSAVLRTWYEQMDKMSVPFVYRYDDITGLTEGLVSQYGVTDKQLYNVTYDLNSNPMIFGLSQKKIDRFDKMKKQAKIMNFIHAALGYDL